jgi:signal transduction histidine kinase/HAMP domain-containing protein
MGERPGAPGAGRRLKNNMQLRTKLLIGILATLLLQMAVMGGFTLTTFLSNARAALDADIRGDWERARGSVEELKHRLYTDLYQLAFILGEELGGQAADRAREVIRYFSSLTAADRIVLIEDPGALLADERSGIAGARAELPVAFLLPRDFRFPRIRFVSVKAVSGEARLFLVTGTAISRPDGPGWHLYLVTDVDATLVAGIQEKTGTEVAFYVGTQPAASSSTREPFPTSQQGARAMRMRDADLDVFSQTLSADLPEKVYLVAFRSLLERTMYVRSVLFSSVTAFLITLAASLFIAAGITSLVISPLRRLSQWMHRYRDTGEAGALDIRSRDEVGFLAGTFHAMVSSLIEEKRVIGEQLGEISLLHAYNERIMDAIPAGIAVTDAAGSIEFCNSYFAELVGSAVPRLAGVRLADVAERSFTMRAGGSMRESLTLDREAVVEGLTRGADDASPRRFTAKISPIGLSGSRRGALVVLEDVTAAERFWAGATIADRVTSMGILSAGMAHEINNPLGSILSHVRWLNEVETEAGKLDSIRWIETETNRIAALVQRIRAYSTPASPGETAADLNRAAAETAEALRFTLERRRLDLGMALDPDLPPVACPPDELKQVTLNILLNAVEASSDGGVLRVATLREDGAGSRAVLRVSDNGVGIPAADLRNVFDPFFTTKQASQGNGLGLSICYAIVRRAGGDIRVRSAPGRGTEVEVLLRVHERPHR